MIEIRTVLVQASLLAVADIFFNPVTVSDSSNMHTHVPWRSLAIMLSIMAKYRQVTIGTSDTPAPDFLADSTVFFNLLQRSLRFANFLAAASPENRRVSIHCLRSPHSAHLIFPIPSRLLSTYFPSFAYL